MTVHEIVKWLTNGDDSIDLPSVERDIRSAVIREVSVGTCTKKETFEQNENGIAGSWRTTTIDPPDLPDGDYDMVPRVTP